uniref:40-residue YVTN family beta-propeller repeat protein n=1 Tax=Solibacter usitatus (strain Ellin6076) TaxID=234267 RepID=Q01VU5_SOLUE
MRRFRSGAPLLFVSLALGLLGFLAARSALVHRAQPAPMKPVTAGHASRTTMDGLPGMPPAVNTVDVYAADRPGNLSPAVQGFPSRIYVPNSRSNSVSVIDPATFKVIDHFRVGRLPQHVTPSYDMKTLWVLNDLGNSLTRVDPATGKPHETIRVRDPYNMYYTPDGKYAIVVAEQDRRLDFLNAADMTLHHSLQVPCKGVDHMDFSADGKYLIASCEFSGSLVKVDVERQEVLGTLDMGPHRMPQDVKLSPDGTVFYIADMHAGGVHLVDGDQFRYIGFIPTGKGAHGLYVSRDSRVLYVSNRDEGSVSVLDFASRKEAAKWRLPGGGSPDMGGVSADGKVLWLAGRYNSEVYAIDTREGKLLARIRVGREPHGLCVYPQPGRYSLGHTGIFR